MVEGQVTRRPSSRARRESTDSARSADGSPSDQTQNAQADSRIRFLAERASDPSNFTVRALVVGSLFGIVVAFSNTYFGLQTGWISLMSMPSALVGFATFKALVPLLKASPFTPMENVLVQTVAQAVGSMPLGCGFVGVIPALEYLLEPTETQTDGNSRLNLSFSKLLVWALGVCFFGVVFGVPLRKELIIREKLKFPNGTATAVLIGVLHKTEDVNRVNIRDGSLRLDRFAGEDGASDHEQQQSLVTPPTPEVDNHDKGMMETSEWKSRIRYMTLAFSGSAIYTVFTYFIPQLHNIPIFGTALANDWVWTLNPSPAYVSQGIIAGVSVSLHMLFGAILGWGILSPLSKSRGWAPGPVDDWDTGSQGWIVWVSLAIMFADAVVNLGWLFIRTSFGVYQSYSPLLREYVGQGDWRHLARGAYSPVTEDTITKSEPDAPTDQLVSTKTTVVGLILTLGLCMGAVQYSFSGLISPGLTPLSLLAAGVLSIMSCRAVGETSLNPVSGISKLTQLMFAAVVRPSSPHAIVINLVAGAIAEAGTLQAGDLLEDLKTGHLVGASPKMQFYGQLIGSAIGAVVATAVYKLYTSVYQIPGEMFRVPAGYVWVFTARLVTGKGLPPKAGQYALVAGAVWTLITIVRIWGTSRGSKWVPWLPGGVAVAIGMYNVPNFTLARAVGGVLAWYWTDIRKQAETPIVLVASGLILGEGLLSIVNLCLASVSVPHL